MSEAATIYDVAARAGVSISTVSLALNQPTRVSPRTLERVLEAAHRLNFRPKSEAVSRARAGFGRIGVLSPFTSYASFHERLNGILERLGEVGQGLELVVFDHESVDGTASAFAGSLPLSERLDGLILMGVPLSRETFARAQARKFPVVMVDVGEPRVAAPTVTTNDWLGGRIAAEHLLESEPATFVYIGIPQVSSDYIFQSQNRQRGFAETLSEHGRELLDAHVGLTVHTVAAATETADELLGRVEFPVGVFCFSDEIAAGVVQAARGRGLRLPHDVAVVGFDDSAIAQAVDITSVHQPLRESGRLAVDLVLAQIRGSESMIEDRPLHLTLTVRGSTMPRAGN